MKLSKWAKKQGISYRTAWRWFKAGQLPVPAEQTKTGTILIKEEMLEPNAVAIYARVSSVDQKNDLNGQVSRLVTFANQKGYLVAHTVTDGSELKDDLVQDMIEVLTSFCARLYGRRSAKNKAKKALETMQNAN